MLLAKIKNSLKAKILTLVFISIFISFAILGVQNTFNSYHAQFNLIKQQEIDLVIQDGKFIDAFIESKINIMESIVEELQNVTINNENPRVTDTFMLAKKAGKFVDVYIGYEKDGSLLLANKDVLNIQKDNYDARKRPWYIDTLKQNKSIVSKPYVDAITKKLIVSVATPFRQNGELVGVVGSDIFIDTIVETILNINIDGLGVASLLDKEGVILIHKNKELLNKKDTDFPQVKSTNSYDFGEVADKMIAYSKINTTNWNLILKLPKDKIYEEIDKEIISEIITYIVLLLIISGLIFYALNKLLSPIAAVEKGFNYFFRYLKGDENNIQKLDINTSDEFGNMAKVINKEMQIIADTLNEDRKLIENVKSVVSNVKDGRLDVEVENSTQNRSLNELKDILNDMIHAMNMNVNKDINVILSHLEEYSKLNFVDSIPDANGNIAKGLNDLCNIINEMLQENRENGLALDRSSNILLENVDVLNTSSNETAVSLEETAAALEEITSTVENNSSRIQEMSDHSNELRQNIKEGQDLATSTVTSMDEINDQTKSIAEAITVIDQIAFQTNILSLNAAVEAATAGEAGKGFAVVAQEVRNLASRSAEAAKEIKDLVESATSKTDNGKNIADKMIKGYEKLNSSIAKTTEAISDIAESSSEQKTSIQQINEVINRLDQQSQNNAAVATQTHEIAGNTSKLANTILETVNKKRFRES